MFSKCGSRVKRITAFILISTALLSLCSCTKDNSGFNGDRFDKTRHISVLVESVPSIRSYDGTKISAESSEAAKYIHDAVLRDCNIDVTFIDSDRLSLVNGITADISFTEDYDSITTYYRMGSVLNIAPYLTQYKESVKHLTELLGEENIYSCTDDTDEVWYLSMRKNEPDSRITFIRKDWLEKLGLEAPSTRDQLHDCLVAFRDNSELLLGEKSASLIPFFIDNEPNVSAKPLFDSFLDTAVSDKEFYVHGYCRVTQPGYEDALRILNSWYLEGLLPKDFVNIRPLTKESYEPVENGYVGAFCAKYNYLYSNGGDSVIDALHANCGTDAEYIAVNTFENRYGEYTSWQEDYLNEGGNKIFLPATCTDPLACLIYLDWISDTENICNIQAVPDSERYLLTIDGSYPDGESYSDPYAESARQTALDVRYIHRGNKCVRYRPYFFRYVIADIDLASVYPDSTKEFICGVILSPEGEFDDVYTRLFEKYGTLGSYVIFKLRVNEWEKVMANGDMKPW